MRYLLDIKPLPLLKPGNTKVSEGEEGTREGSSGTGQAGEVVNRAAQGWFVLAGLTQTYTDAQAHRPLM